MEKNFRRTADAIRRQGLRCTPFQPTTNDKRCTNAHFSSTPLLLYSVCYRAFFVSKMRIEDIIYDTTREVLNVEDKLRIATVFLFCDKLGSEKLSQLLYTKNHASFIDELNNEYAEYEVDFSVNFSNPNIKSAFYKTLEKVKEKWDSNGFLKALSEGDEFALVICEIVNYEFDKVEFKKFTKQVATQLSLWG